MVERKTAAVGVGICSVLAMAAGAALYRRERSIAVSQLEIKAAVTAPLRVVHLSDLHGRVFGKGNQRLLSKILSCGPDLIVVTGNLVGANPPIGRSVKASPCCEGSAIMRRFSLFAAARSIS